MAGNWDYVFWTEYTTLLQYLPAHFGQSESVGCRIVLFQPSGGLDGLKCHPTNAGLLQAELDDAAYFVVVQPFLQRHHESGRNAVTIQAIQGLLSRAAQIGAAQFHERIAFEGIELEIDLKVGHALRYLFDEVFVLGHANTVGIDHEVSDGSRLGQFQHGEEVRMQRRLAPGNLHYVGLAFVADDSVKQLLDVRERAVLHPCRSAARVTDGAGKVTVVVDFDQRKTGMLLVVGTEAAVVGASPFDRRVVNHGHFRSLDKNLAAAAVVVDIVRNKNTLRTVPLAFLQQVDIAVLKDDLALHLCVTPRADGDRDVVEEIGSGS